MHYRAVRCAGNHSEKETDAPGLVDHACQHERSLLGRSAKPSTRDRRDSSASRAAAVALPRQRPPRDH
jgi:hypothetical protein